jgi:hypothetical protein
MMYSDGVWVVGMHGCAASTRQTYTEPRFLQSAGAATATTTGIAAGSLGLLHRPTWLAVG